MPVLGIKVNGNCIRQVALMGGILPLQWGKLPSYTATALAWWEALNSLPFPLYSQQELTSYYLQTVAMWYHLMIPIIRAVTIL